MSINRHQANGAYRTWSLPAFDAPKDAAEPEAPPPPPEPEPAPQPAYALPTADDIERMYEDARTEGYAAGHAEGLEEGRREGRAAGVDEGQREGQAQAREQGEAVARQLGELMDGLEARFAALDAEIAEEILALAVEVARQVVGRTLADEPTAICETVRQALAHLPQRQIAIRLNPDDVGLVREYLGELVAHGAHRLIEDDQIGRGGCILETPTSQLDATVPVRWRRVLEGMGRSGQADWDGAPDEDAP